MDLSFKGSGQAERGPSPLWRSGKTAMPGHGLARCSGQNMHSAFIFHKEGTAPRKRGVLLYPGAAEPKLPCCALSLHPNQP